LQISSTNSTTTRLPQDVKQEDVINITEATVLIVDDEPELLEIYQAWVERKRAKVFTAPNGLAALDFIASNTIDVIISDVRMPVMDGMTLVRRLSEREKRIPSVIFVSVFSDIDSREAYALGVEAMLTKPTGRHDLITTLEKILRPRDEMWSSAPTAAADCQIRADFPSLSDTSLDQAFALGRGGCRVNVLPVPGGGLVDLSLTFGGDELHLEGQGIIRWSDLITPQTGIEFSYLTPESRAWVTSQILSNAPRSFIPG
jgi:CheY-like chemotaxis protein